MGKNYRFRTTPGQDKNIRMTIEQDFDFIEILSLKLKQSDVYTRFCADYGVVTGRVVANGGFGVPNVSISVFVPLSSNDENDIVISTLYPYKRIDQKNEDGYRYNLLPYRKEYGGHTPTGTFPDREDILKRQEVLEVYEKYYKYTVRTNDSGDFMIVGVPLGIQTVMMDMDLSNIGCFSQRPSDLIRMGMGVEAQFAGTQFRSSSDLDSLPQIINSKKDVDVASFWGEGDICNVGITRVDFDLRDLGIVIEPQAIFMGSLFSTDEQDSLGLDCKPKFDSGNLCDLVTGRAKILAIRQTIQNDSDGFPLIEEYKLPEGGNVVDDNGTWLIELPMNLDYVITNEFGEQVLSNDPGVGIPTKAKYRFKVIYQNEDPENNNSVRADYLIPNIKEYGWNLITTNEPANQTLRKKSYAFSLDWNDYGDTGTTLGNQMIQEAINCEDRFFEFNYNRVYTVSSFIDRWKWGYNRSRHLGIKEITDRSCTTTTNRFPVNDGVRNFDTIFFIFNLLLTVFTPVFYIIIYVWHFVAKFYFYIRFLVNVLLRVINFVYRITCALTPKNKRPPDNKNCQEPLIPLLEDRDFPRLYLPMISYPDCESCTCENYDIGKDSGDPIYALERVNYSPLIDSNSNGEWLWTDVFEYNKITSQDYCNVYDTCNLNNDTFTLGLGQGFAGYIGPYSKFSKVPISTWYEQDSRIGSLSFTNTWSQTLNKMNSRSSYFNSGNIIRTTVKNINPQSGIEDPSDTFTDLPLILICDVGTLESLGGPSQLLTFTNVENINDPNLTGATLNQFNTFSVTGTTINNTNTLIPVTRQYIKPDQNPASATLKLRLTENGKDYKFKSGVEYYQIITGGTLSSFETISNIYSSFGLLRTHVYENQIKLRWGKGYGETKPLFKGPGQPVFDIILQNDGNVVAGGDFFNYYQPITSPSQIPASRIVRLNPNTAVSDFSFDVNIGNGPTIGINALEIQPGDQKIIVGGNWSDWNFNTAASKCIIRLNTDGTVDSTFNSGGSGFSNDNTPGLGSEQVYSLKLQSDGKVLVGGRFDFYNSTPVNGIIRLNTNGSVDTSFWANLVSAPYVGTNLNGFVYSIDTFSDGRIILAGKFTTFVGQPYNNIVMLNSDGTINTSFSVGSGFDNTVNVVKVDQATNKIYVGGIFTTYQSTNVSKILRLNDDGSIDTNFNTQNILSQTADSVKTIEFDTINNNIIVGGFFTNGNNRSLLRLNNDGSIDATFDTAQSETWVENGTITINKIKQLSNGDFIVGGYFGLYDTSSNQYIRLHLTKLDNTGKEYTTINTSIQVPFDQWKNVGNGFPIFPKDYFSDFDNKEIIILTKGVDPYTEKQTIEYDLSTLFGQQLDTVKVKGEYYLNIPIQRNKGNTPTPYSWQEPTINNSLWYDSPITPESHDIINNNNDSLYHIPYNNFNIPSVKWTAYTNNSIKYYTSTDKSRQNHTAYNGDSRTISSFTSPAGVYSDVTYQWTNGKNTIGFQWTQGDPPDTIPSTYYEDNPNTIFPQGNIEGNSFIGSDFSPGTLQDLTSQLISARVYSPAYHLDYSPDLIMSNKSRLVLRSDRLPTSTTTEVEGNNSYSLFLNDNFTIYKVDENGEIINVSFQINQSVDTTNNLQDFSEDNSSTLSSAVINTLTCEGMKPLDCYVGQGETFGVLDPCLANEESDLATQRVIGGCYYFVQEKYLSADSLSKDFKLFAEWKARFRFTYAACRGVISHVFQNNWVNGSLYMFGFKRKVVFDAQGNLQNTLYCGSQTNLLNRDQGPIYYDVDTNSYYYRSTPYFAGLGYIGQKPQYFDITSFSWQDAAPKYKGMNERNIFFPTTLMDLGPRDQFAKEICLNPELQGYLVETIKSTSYNETSDLLLFFILSRLLSSTNTQRILGLGDASINSIFSRSEDRLDGDLAQMFSINSEYGILPFTDQFYNDNDIFLSSTGNALVGVLFSSNTINRILLTPGTNTFGTVQQTIPYPLTQEVPMYKWKKVDPQPNTPSSPQPPPTIFGSELNDWYTDLDVNNVLYSTKYQTMDFNGNPYFQTTNGQNTGYIFNYDFNGNPTSSPSQNQATDTFIVGAPYHFYFGLVKGKSAINRYISKYIIG